MILKDRFYSSFLDWSLYVESDHDLHGTSCACASFFEADTDASLPYQIGLRRTRIRLFVCQACFSLFSFSSSSSFFLEHTASKQFRDSLVNRPVMDDISFCATENRIGSTIQHRRLDQKGINPLRSVLRHAWCRVTREFTRLKNRNSLVWFLFFFFFFSFRSIHAREL